MERQRILIIDAQPAIAHGLAVLARGLGYEVQVAYGAEEALTRLRTSRPDLITLDLQLPHKSAWDVLRILRADRAFDQMPIVVSSDSETESSRQQAMEAGAQDYFNRNEAFEKFGEIVRQQLALLRAEVD